MTCVLVTGGSGFIGQHLVGTLVASGRQARVLDLRPPGRAVTNAQYIKGSVLDHAGDVLTFVMHNISPGIGDLFSDPALNGPYDGLAVGTQHIYSTRYTATFPIFDSIPVGVFVSFEDLRFRDSNFNYDDLDFVFTNVTAAETPVPAALPLFASGLGALGLLGWRRKQRKTFVHSVL